MAANQLFHLGGKPHSPSLARSRETFLCSKLEQAICKMGQTRNPGPSPDYLQKMPPSNSLLSAAQLCSTDPSLISIRPKCWSKGKGTECCVFCLARYGAPGAELGALGPGLQGVVYWSRHADKERLVAPSILRLSQHVDAFDLGAYLQSATSQATHKTGKQSFSKSALSKLTGWVAELRTFISPKLGLGQKTKRQ